MCCLRLRWQRESVDVTMKVNQCGELQDRHLRAACAVALVSAVTGYRYNPKVRGRAAMQAAVASAPSLPACRDRC